MKIGLVTLVPTGCGHQHGSSRALSLMAPRAAQPFHHVIESCFPPGERRQRVRVAAANVTALAPEINQVLAEFVAELLNVEVAHSCTVHIYSLKQKCAAAAALLAARPAIH
jgi:hypothetical protein